MATNYTIPFAKGEDIKSAFSPVDQSYNIDNIRSSLDLARDDLVDVISQAVYDRMLTYFNDPNPVHEINAELVLLCQRAMIPLGLHHHFIWLQLRISNNSITVVKTNDETAAYKYQTDEAKDELLKSAWSNINILIAFLNRNPSITEWTTSDQYSILQELLFPSYKEFEKYYGIDRNAAFFIKTRFIQQDILIDEVIPRFGKVSEISDAQLLIKLKRAVSFRMIAQAILRFDAFWLPTSIRKDVTSEVRKRSINSVTDQFLKENMSNALDEKASEYFEYADMFWSSLNSDDTSSESPLADYEPNISEENKFFNGL